MSLPETRFGADATPLPAVLPPISTALSRRAALFGAVTVAGATASLPMPPLAGPVPLSANDARLAAIAAELRATDDRLTVLAAAHSKAEDLPEWDALIDRFEPLEEEMAETPSDTLAGVLAKARAARVPPVLNCLNGIGDSIAADLVRLFGGALL